MSVQIVSALFLSFLMVVMPVHGATVIIANPSPEPLGAFGHSIDVADGLLVVGAYGDSVGQSSVGKVWIFNAVTGYQMRTLVSPNPGYGPGLAGLFGWAVKIADHLVIVGAPGEAVNGVPEAGRVYLFNARTGALVNTLVSPNPENDGFFGAGLAQENGLVYVGASIETVNGIHAAGRVYAFSIRTGELMATFISPSPEQGGVFGIALAVSDGRLIAGAEDTVDGFGRAGRAYVFNATSGSLINTLVTTNPATNGFFGNSVVIANQLAVVGAFDESVNRVSSAGRVYLFNATTGSLITTLVSPNVGTGGGGFGVSVELATNHIIIGAPSEMVNATFGVGRVYVFDTATGALIRTLVNPEPQFQAQFGLSIGLANDRVYVGAPGVTVSGQFDAGAVYIFSRVIGHGQYDSDDEQS